MRDCAFRYVYIFCIYLKRHLIKHLCLYAFQFVYSRLQYKLSASFLPRRSYLLPIRVSTRNNSQHQIQHTPDHRSSTATPQGAASEVSTEPITALTLWALSILSIIKTTTFYPWAIRSGRPSSHGSLGPITYSLI